MAVGSCSWEPAAWRALEGSSQTDEGTLDCCCCLEDKAEQGIVSGRLTRGSSSEEYRNTRGRRQLDGRAPEACVEGIDLSALCCTHPIDYPTPPSKEPQRAVILRDEKTKGRGHIASRDMKPDPPARAVSWRMPCLPGNRAEKPPG